MPNEVEETLRVIKDDIEYNESKLDKIDKTANYISDSHIPEEHKTIILDSLGFSMAFHNHKIIKLNKARDEVMEKYEVKQ